MAEKMEIITRRKDSGRMVMIKLLQTDIFGSDQISRDLSIFLFFHSA